MGLTTVPVMLNDNIETYLNSHYVLSQIAHANTPATDIDSLTETAHTPVYHLETAQGWSNDLQTINWNEKGGYYDIYFLHSVDGATNPFGLNGQNWTHCTTKDFVHFSEQNDAISSNVKNSMSGNDQSWKSAWTGSVVQNQGNISGVPKGDYVAYFSGLKKADGSQNIWAAWSDDNGRTFSHVLNNGNPVLPYNASFASNDKDNERDAYVCYWNGKMLMYCAEGDKLGVYQSTDGVNWSKADPAGASKVLASTFMKGVNWTDANKPVECPCLKMMTTPDGQTKAVLLYGDKTPQDGQTTGTYYVVGHLDANGLFAAETNAKRLDLGSDYYGSNFSGTDDLNKPNSSINTMGWVGNWSYTSQGVHNSQDGTGPYTGRLGSYTLPRKLTLNNDLTLSSNIDDSSLHVTNTHIFDNVTKDNPATKDGNLNILGQDADYGPIYTLADIPNLSANSEYDLEFTNSDGYKGRIYIDIWQGADYVKLNFDPTNNNFRVAGKATELNDDLSGTKASSAYYDGMLGKGNGYAEHLDSNTTYPKYFHLKIFTDKDSIEFQFPNGQTYTVARYAINDNQDFKVYTQDPTGNNTMNLVTNTVDVLPKSTTGNSSSSNSAPSSSSATPKPNDSKPSTDTKPTPAVSSAKPSDTNTTYKYSVAYFNNATGQSIKTIDFNSSSQLSDNDLRNKISASAPGKVVKYNIDQTKKNNDGSTTVDVIVLVDTNSVNTTTSSLSNQAPSSSSSQSANKPTASSPTSSSKSTDTKPVTSNSKTNSKPAQSGDKPLASSSKADTDKATSASSTKPDDHKASSSNSDKNDNQKPAAGNSYDSNKVTSSSTKDDNKSSSSNKTSNNKPTVTNSDKSNNNADNKPATSVSESKLDNKSTSSTKADHDKTNLHSDKSDNSHKGEPTHKTDTESAQHGGSSTKTDSNKATDKKSAISSMSESSKKNSDNSEINSVKSNSSSSNKHNGEADTESVKSLSSSNSSSKKNLSVKNEVSSESSLTNSAKSGKTNENSKNKTVNRSSVEAELKNGTDNETDVNSLTSSTTAGNSNQANGSQSNDVFQQQTADGTNNNIEPNQGAVTNTDNDTYSAQKAAMLARTNAKSEQGGIVSIIGTVIGMIAGWFGLKKKN